jgi:hypothetical protein
MPDIQEVIALGIVAAVAGRLLWRRWAHGKPQGKTVAKPGVCGDCTAAEPPKRESTVHFYRRREAGPPADGSRNDGA